MQKIVTVYPLLSTHTNLTDQDAFVRLLPIEDPTDPEEGLFLYASKEAISYPEPEIALSKKLSTPLGIVKPQDSTFSTRDQTNLSFLARFINKEKNSVMFRFDIFSKLVSEPLLLMRLFAPGDIFVTHAIPSGYPALKLASDFEGLQKHYYFNQDEILVFKSFFQNYWKKLRILDPYIKQTGPLAQWSKKIGNALYFFNKSYFTKTQTSLDPDSRPGNIDRLMALITALDALFGISPSGDELAQNASCLLKYFYKDSEKNIKEFYELRSNWVHANEHKLTSRIPNRRIERLSQYVQKACLISLELFCNEAIRNGYTASGKRHMIHYLTLLPKEVEAATQTVKDSGQSYDRWES